MYSTSHILQHELRGWIIGVSHFGDPQQAQFTVVCP